MIVPNSPEHLELMALDARVDDAIAELHRALGVARVVKKRVVELMVKFDKGRVAPPDHEPKNESPF